jgi:dGTPase
VLLLLVTAMLWETLLTSERVHNVGRHGHKPPSSTADDVATNYQEDIERILYSPAFRRLQNKTQVHPLPKSDYPRTRLTHSLEVAQVARIIGTAIGKRLVPDKNKKFPKNHTPGDLGDIVYAACLAHDVGNPPFGHNGEEAIQSWFSENDDNPIVKAVLKDRTKKYDFLNFDGNAQTFRILTRLQSWRQEGGLQLSYAVLGTFMKYPFSSKVGETIYKKKKFGFMQEDAETACRILDKLGLKRLSSDHYARHPLAFICEAADDICYRTTDIEDGYKAGVISFTDAEGLLRGLADGRYLGRYADVERDDDKIQYLRSTAISTLIDDVFNTFLHHRYGEIMEGKFDGGLLEVGKHKKQIDAVAEVCDKKLYVERSKMEIEAAGYHVIHFLLTKFGNMLKEYYRVGNDKDLSAQSRNLYNLFPKDNLQRRIAKDEYKLCCYLVDFISGMSDRYAVDLYKKISGIGISLGV